MILTPVDDDGRPPFDVVKADALLNSYVLVGVSIERKNGEFVRNEQFHGVVERVDAHHGMKIALRGSNEGETKWLPPALDAFEPARPGTYTLHCTSELITDPDFLATFTLVRPDA